MALGLVSPGVLVREIDRTVGAVDASFSIVGALQDHLRRVQLKIPF